MGIIALRFDEEDDEHSYHEKEEEEQDLAFRSAALVAGGLFMSSSLRLEFILIGIYKPTSM